jgi:hypothetical protein
VTTAAISLNWITSFISERGALAFHIFVYFNPFANKNAKLGA